MQFKTISRFTTPLLLSVAVLAVSGCDEPIDHESELLADAGDVIEDSDGSDDEDPTGETGDAAEFPTDADQLVSEDDPAASCVDCGWNNFYACSSLGWQYACPPGSFALHSTGPTCAVCAETVCYPVPASGNVDASPTTVQVSGATGCTNISWSSCRTAQVWVSHNGAAETLFAQGKSGNQSACWIQPGHTYDFCVYEGTEHANQLDCVTVTGEAAGPAPDPCDVCAPGRSCHCEPGVCWPDHLACP